MTPAPGGPCGRQHCCSPAFAAKSGERPFGVAESAVEKTSPSLRSLGRGNLPEDSGREMMQGGGGRQREREGRGLRRGMNLGSEGRTGARKRG